MKKIILTLITLLPLNILANEKIYTDYTLKEENQTIYLENNEYLKRKEKIKYNTYILEKKDEGYQLPNENNKNLIKDENDFKIKYYLTKERKTDDQIYYIFYNAKYNSKVYRLIISDSTYLGTIDHIIEYIKVINKDKEIININNLIPYKDSNQTIIFDFDKSNVWDLTYEIKYKDIITTKANYFGELKAYGTNLAEVNNLNIPIQKNNTIFRQMYLSNEDYEKVKSLITWEQDPTSNTKILSGYLNKDILYHYYSYQKVTLNNYTEIDSENYYIDYNDSKTYYDYYQRYYYILKDTIDLNNIKNIILETNTNLNDVKINYTENETNYLVQINYLDTTVYKIYPKQENKTSKKVSNNNIKVVNKIISEDILNKEEQVNNETEDIKNTPQRPKYIYYTIIIPIVMLTIYTIYYHKKK